MVFSVQIYQVTCLRSLHCLVCATRNPSPVRSSIITVVTDDFHKLVINPFSSHFQPRLTSCLLGRPTHMQLGNNESEENHNFLCRLHSPHLQSPRKCYSKFVLSYYCPCSSLICRTIASFMVSNIVRMEVGREGHNAC
jgi:hypothetical protein